MYFIQRNWFSSFFGNGFNNIQPQQPGVPGATASDPSGMGCGTPPASCPSTRYRSYDGSCNNLRNPVWGTPNTPYTRLLPANYGDGKFEKKFYIQ